MNTNPVLDEIEKYKRSEKLLVKLDTNRSRKITLCYPEIYPIGMPNLGIQHMLRIINSRKDFFAGRCYMPGSHAWKNIIENKYRLVDWDSMMALDKSDILSFTISFEDQYLNIIRMLKFSGINPVASMRKESDPIIIGAGPCASYNPEPLADFFDAFIIGEGEEVIHEILDEYNSSSSREDFLSRIDKIDCVYIPSRYKFEFNKEKIAGITKEAKEKVYRKYVKDINLNPVRSSIINPVSVYGREVFSIEISRGCQMHCRFCYMGNHFRKQRLLSLSKIRETISEGIGHTKNIKLFYESLPERYMIEFFNLLCEMIDKENIVLNLGSFRLENLTPEIIDVILKGSQKSVILAPETSDGKLRNLINKGGISDNDIKKMAEICIKKGITELGLYLLVGLPTETNEDLQRLAKLIIDTHNLISSINNKAQLEVHINSFFPKPLTPLQWERNISQTEAQEKFNYIKSIVSRSIPVENLGRLRYKSIISNEITFSQPILARGDRRLGAVLLDLTINTSPYNNSETSIELWKKFLSLHQLVPEFYYRSRDVNEILPWSLINNSINERYLLEERRKAYGMMLSERCPEKDCNECMRCRRGDTS